MKKAVMLTMLFVYLTNITTFAQKRAFRKKIEKEISTYPKAFAQRAIFEVSRYFRMRGSVLPEVQIQFRGIRIIRRQLSDNTCIYEFIRQDHKVILPEDEVRSLVNLPPTPGFLLAKKPID